MFHALLDFADDTKTQVATGSAELLSTAAPAAAGSVCLAGTALALQHDKNERRYNADRANDLYRPYSAARPEGFRGMPANDLWFFAEQSRERAADMESHMAVLDPRGSHEKRILGGLITARFGNSPPKSTIVHYSSTFVPGHEADVFRQGYYGEGWDETAIKEMQPVSPAQVPLNSTYQREIGEMLAPRP
jgi:hypothetical protein